MTSHTHPGTTASTPARPAWSLQILRLLLACGLLVAAMATRADAATTTRTATPDDTCNEGGPFGALVLPGSAWLGGEGVNVYSNCNIYVDDGPSDYTAKGVLIGTEWQCAELVNRLYLTRGWTTSTWWGNGNQMYEKAPANLHKEPQGHISTIGPGDAVSYSGGEFGHVAIVNSVAPNGSGGFTVNLINQNANLHTSTTLKNGSLTAPWSGFAVIGVIHAPTTAMISNGSFVNFNGNVYRIAGGAPLYVSSWSVFGGPQPTQVVTQTQFDSLAKYPANGTAVAVANAGAGHGDGFVFAGGAPLAVKAWPNVNNPQWTRVDGNALSHFSTTEPYDHVLQYPANGTAVAIGNSTEHGSGFVFAGGAPLVVKKWTNVGNPHVTTVDANALDTYTSNPSDPWHPYNHVRQYPVDGTAVAVGNPVGHGTGYDFAGGAPLNVAAWSNVGTPKWVVVDSAALDTYSSTDTFHVFDHVRDFPVNGTFLRTQAGDIYRTAGGAAIYISSCAPIGGCGTPAVTDPWVISHAGESGVHLTATPSNGTIVEGMPSKHFWKFEGGKRSTTSSSTAAVAVNDGSLTKFPIA